MSIFGKLMLDCKMLKSVMAAASLSLIGAVGANASTVISVSGFDSGSYSAGYGLGPNVGEDFETLGAALGEGEVGTLFDTAVGTFSALGGVGSGGTVTGLSGNTGERLALRDGSVFGRKNNAPRDGQWFLDSNDTFGMLWDVSLGGREFSSLSFVLQDASDTGAYLRISAGGTDYETRTGGRLSNGHAQLVTIDFGQVLTEATVALGNYTMSGGTEYRANDGFSIDGLQVTAVPLPAPMLMLATAIAGFGMMRRRQNRKAA